MGEPLRLFARHLGVAFQILNDLNDWQGDCHNKLAAGSDVLEGRPTLLWALALEALPSAEQEELLGLVDGDPRPSAERIQRTRVLYHQAGVFEKAHGLVDRYQERAAAIADGVAPAGLQRLLHYLIETVLERPAEDVTSVSEPAVCFELTGAAPAPRNAGRRGKGAKMVITTRRSAPELEVLARLYYETVDELGCFEEVDEKDLPPAYRTLLAHDEHMTEALEAFHACNLAVEVLLSTVNETHYRRKVILKRRSDQAVVLFGIVRVTRALLPPEIRDAIEGEKIPLGRILIRSEMLRHVRLLSLWKIEPRDDLCRIFGFAKPQTCYGRTALMYCDSVPVIELLEIVTAG